MNSKRLACLLTILLVVLKHVHPLELELCVREQTLGFVMLVDVS